MTTNDTSIDIKIGKIWNSSEGTTEKFHLNHPVKFDSDEISPLGNMDCDLLLIKLRGEISVLMTDFSIKLKVKCERCLKEMEYDMEIKSAERQFLAKKEKGDSDAFESFTINMQKMSIDLSDMIRQEIILHFPLISLCSKSCKGLCDSCGANLNEKKCKCAPEEDLTSQKPFKELKTLIKAPQKRGKPKKR